MQAEDTFSDLYSIAYDLLNQNKDYQSEIDFVLSRFALNSHGKLPISVLDLGCGTGLHLSCLPPQVESALGVDISESMIKKAILNNKKLNVNFLESDIYQFQSDKKYELVMMLFHVLSYQTQLSSLLDCFKVLSSACSKNGKIIVDFWHRAAWESDPPVKRITEKENEELRVVRESTPKIDYVNGIVDVDMKIHVQLKGHDSQTFFENHKMKALTVTEIELLANASGLRILEIGDWNGLSGDSLRKETWYGYAVFERER